MKWHFHKLLKLSRHTDHGTQGEVIETSLQQRTPPANKTVQQASINYSKKFQKTIKALTCYNMDEP